MTTRGHHGILLNDSHVYLDQLSITPLTVHSLKKLISTATTSIRVRRSSDNAEQDIGFSGIQLDTTALAAFVGANSAFVTTIYDQTGGGRDNVQATAANQPRIVNAGVYDGLIVYDGTNDMTSISSVPLNLPQCGIYMDARMPPAIGTHIFFEHSATWNSNVSALIFYMMNNSYEAGMSDSAVAATHRAISYGAMNMTSRVTATILYDRSLTGLNEIKVWQAGGAITPTSVIANEMTGSFASYPMFFGGRSGGSLFSTMALFSFVIYNADTAAIRTQIEAAI